ncbi:MAG: ferritin-like domain-containing protein [Chitinispirillaceae bacterium]
MENKEIIKKLSSLMKLDYDATQAYEKALDNISDMDIKARIRKYHDDHMRHVDNLSDIITGLGGTPPERSSDIRGLFLSGVAALQGITGTGGALKSLQSGEKITNKSYNDAVHQDFPLDIKNVLEGNFRDEQIHMEYINSMLETKPYKD